VGQVPYLMPPRATELILVRHGATEAARPGESFPLVDGRGDPTLTEAGIAGARAVAAKLRAEALAGIFVTPLRRTAETAAPLASAIGVEPIEVPELTEVHLGEAEGGQYLLRAAAGDPAIRRAFVEQRWDAIPGAESAADLSSRARMGLERVVTAVGPGAAAVVVSHGGTIGELCRQAVGAEPLSLVHADNCSISRLIVFPSGRLLLRSFNEIGHLRFAL
jgi:probable phosphoglycerate mutase